MENLLLPIFALLTLAVVATHGALPPEVYRKSVLPPNTPIPKAVTDVLHPDLVNYEKGRVNYESEGEDYGKGGEYYGKGREYYGKDGKYYGKGREYYEKGGEYYGKGGENYGKGGDDYGKGGEDYGKGGDDYGNGGEYYGKGGEYYGKGREYYKKGGEDYGKGGEDYGKGGEYYEKGGEDYGKGGEDYGKGGEYYGKGGKDYGKEGDNYGKGGEYYEKGREYYKKGGKYYEKGGKYYGKGRKNYGKGAHNIILGGKGGVLFTYKHAATTNQLHDDTAVTRFFKENDLHYGTKMDLHFTPSFNQVTFLPRQVADSIPFSSSKVNDVFIKFSIKPESEEANVVKNTLSECEETSIKGEEKYCATSLESMVDFITSKLGKNLVVLSTEVNQDTGLQQYTIAPGVKKISGDKVVVCHKQNYPYAVFHCHKTETTRTYFVPLKGANGIKVKAVAVCHTDTSQWNPKHLAFQVLKVKPGTVHVCHFLPADHVVWVQK
ncbi:hypothetical protein V8G54_008921 [Vigna mungo]|uniref:BURP domain-containing protein n=1 Tax=Vigna mungo TaxID=3915 RepID=A0AAQ3P4H1_VIGMU